MELTYPNTIYFDSYVSAIHEYRENGVISYNFLAYDKYNIFDKIENSKTGNNLPEGYVKATYLWLVDKEEFIGEVSIRHSLTNSLLRFGGNIGYGIRYSRWNNGLGTIMLSNALVYAKEMIGLDKVLITCNDDNLGSARVIEKNGGCLLDKIVNVVEGTERLTRRYWIVIEQ